MNDEVIVDGLAEALDEETSASENIQNALNLNENEVDINQLLKLYQWIKTHSSKVIFGLIGIILGLSSYFFYSQDFKNDTTEHIKRIDKQLESINKDIDSIQIRVRLIKINQSNIENMKYRIESLKEITKLNLEIEKMKHQKNLK